ncbi:MAG: SIR2 family protein [Ignavibacteriaceae bacterium]|jgi:hypothetical protein|nr:SIR2 family protein [Ignavibacteriaceae bacterium]
MSKILILGAGASYGHGLFGKPSPPLINNFFTENTIKIFSSSYTPLFDHLKNINHSGDLEQIFGTLDSYSSLLPLRNRRTNIARYGHEFEYCIPIDFLRAYTIDVIVFHTLWLNKGETCPYHNYLANNWLEKNDLSISFNYDLIFDSSLKKSGLWHESTGYGRPIRLFDNNEYENSKVMLLKPHGSLNWERFINPQIEGIQKDSFIAKEAFTIEVFSLNKTFDKYKEIPEYITSWIETIKSSTLPQDDFRRELFCFREDSMDGVPYPCIIMPTPLKPLSQFRYGIMKDIWPRIEDKLLNADELLSIGFSWRDTHFNSLVLSVINQRKKQINISIVGNEQTFQDTNTLFSKINSTKVSLKHIGNTFKEIIINKLI